MMGEMFPHSQQQSSVSRQPTWLERLAVVIVAALWVHADDVITGESTTSVMQEIQSKVAPCWKDFLTAQEDTVSPVCVQILSQLADCF